MDYNVRYHNGTPSGWVVYINGKVLGPFKTNREAKKVLRQEKKKEKEK
jgi:hypothetical protein